LIDNGFFIIASGVLAERYQVAIPETEGEAKAEKETEAKKERKKTSVVPPDGVTDIVWQDFIDLRKAKKAPISQSALDGISKEAGKAGITLQAALEMCCMRGWTGFKAEWLKDKDAEQKSFAEKEYDFKRERWEAMTGRTPQAEIKSYNLIGD
jgi:hypothetical protein